MPSAVGLLRESFKSAADDLTAPVRGRSNRLNLSPKDLDTRQALGPGGGRIKETYLGGKWWRFSAGRTAGYEPEALNGDSQPGPPAAALARAKRRAARSGRTGR